MILLKFLAQGAAIDAEARCGFGLVVIAVAKHGLQHRLFDFRNNRIEKIARQFAVEVVKILAYRLFYRLL